MPGFLPLLLIEFGHHHFFRKQAQQSDQTKPCDVVLTLGEKMEILSAVERATDYWRVLEALACFTARGLSVSLASAGLQGEVLCAHTSYKNVALDCQI